MDIPILKEDNVFKSISNNSFKEKTFLPWIQSLVTTFVFAFSLFKQSDKYQWH